MWPRGQWARKVLSEPLRERLWFAGEAVHENLWGTVGGAWEAGERAAESLVKNSREINAARMSSKWRIARDFVPGVARSNGFIFPKPAGRIQQPSQYNTRPSTGRTCEKIDELRTSTWNEQLSNLEHSGVDGNG